MSLLLALTAGTAPAGITGTATTGQAQTTAATSTPAVTVAVSTAQGQTIAATGTQSVGGSVSTAQAQTAAANIAQSVSGFASTGQAQSGIVRGDLTVTGSSSSSQSQTASGLSLPPEAIIAVATSGQSQSASAAGSVVSVLPPVTVGGGSGGNDNGVSGIATKPEAVEAKRYEVLKYEQPQDTNSAGTNQTAILERLQIEGYGKQDTASAIAKTDAAIAKILAGVPGLIGSQSVQAVQASIEVNTASRKTQLDDDEAYMLMMLALEVMA